MGKCNRNMRLHSTLAYAKTLGNISIAQSVYTTHNKHTATLLGHRVYLAHYYIIKFLVAQLHITRHIIALNITCRLIITERSIHVIPLTVIGQTTPVRPTTKRMLNTL